MASGYIRVYLGDALKDQVALDSDRLTIGRAAENDLVLAGSGVSGHHATILREGNKLFIEDNNSTNGVFVNKQQVQRAEIQYWDEIQIFNFVLKPMALSGLGTDADPDAPDTDAGQAADKTLVVDLSDDERRDRLRNAKKTAYCVTYDKDGREDRIDFRKVSLDIGRSRDCDIRAGGWLAPRRAAELERGADGYYLVPHRRGKVTLNGVGIVERARLNDGDAITVRDRRLVFFHRVMDDE